MRIVNRKEFLALPSMTLYSKYAPCYFEDLQIKGETWPHDFLTHQVADAIKCTSSENFSDKLFCAQETGCSLEMDWTCWGRDGCFDEDQLFAVWETDDLKGLIGMLSKCLEVATNAVSPAVTLTAQPR